ncbi:acyl carrier protein [Patulibacter minatonensis]|uniref:acyl carrier protein n=1 Tax=Patulibacter minatonensis TaxID=298163 RepID=UPI0004AD87A1|nr:acyl carrier protein [Patulibacter minatonensis]
MPVDAATEDSIRQALAGHAGMDADAGSIARDADLYDAGMSSHASVNVMLAVEEAFDVEFPDELMVRGTFRTIETIAAAVAQLAD